MNQAPHDDHYDEWLRQMRGRQAPPDLSHQIMDAIDREIPENPSAFFARAAFWAKAAIFTTAALVGVSRYALLLFCVLFG